MIWGAYALALWRSLIFLSHTQKQPLESLAEKWSLADHCMEGYSDYLFPHDMGELLLYQLKESK